MSLRLGLFLPSLTLPLGCATHSGVRFLGMGFLLIHVHVFVPNSMFVCGSHRMTYADRQTVPSVLLAIS